MNIPTLTTNRLEDVSFRVCDVVQVRFDLPGTAPHAFIIDTEPPMGSLEIPLGLPEAQALALALHQERGTRPGSLELFNDVLTALRVDVIAARIYARIAGVYHAQLHVMSERGDLRFECRSSDAMILAVRANKPILFASALFAELA
jgi:bifunctional DNase/RNase